MAWLSTLANSPFEYIGNHAIEVVWATAGQPGHFGSSVTINTPTTLGRPAWEHAFQQASNESPAPLARVLFVDALRSIEARKFRSAIIDASTATEVALSAAMSNWLDKNSSAAISTAVINRTRMLGALVSLANEVGFNLPPRIMKDLIEVRNRVIHQGVEVGQQEASNACAVARSILDQYDPLPTLGP
jgi:hypothetical protein